MKVHPALFEGEGKGRAKKIEEHFSQLTKQYYFTAKIMLKYCPENLGRPADVGLTSDCRRHS